MTFRVLLLGAGGFIGSHVAAALVGAGWQVTRAVRPGRALRDGEIDCDLARLREPADWLPLLDGIDAVVNAAGILREKGDDRFETIHVSSPLALARACVERGITRFVQVSALGAPDDGEFIASKHRFDRALLECLPRALVLRPSVVCSATGSYGGTSLLRALAATPGMMALPGNGHWPLQPLVAEDLAALVVAGLRSGCHGVYEVGGPQAMPLRDYQLRWRAWLRVGGTRCVQVPTRLIDLLVALGERLGQGPMGTTMWRMLKRGNTTDAGAHARLQRDFGTAPRDLDVVLAASPSQVQDRWHAQLYLLATPLKLAVIALWLLSAAAGWLTPAARIEALAAGSGLSQLSPVLLARSTALLDLALAVWLMLTPRPRPVVALMGLSVVAFTVAFGVLIPGLWLDPLGGLAKNLVVLPALAALWVLCERR